MAQSNKQKRVIDIFKKDSQARVYALLELISDTKEAIENLPAKNENGEPIVHGDNCQMYNILDFLRLQLISYRSLIGYGEFEVITSKYPDWKKG